nr:MAG TPA: hypothetical protein [Caudoviricetes sp.]
MLYYAYLFIVLNYIYILYYFNNLARTGTII